MSMSMSMSMPHLVIVDVLPCLSTALVHHHLQLRRPPLHLCSPIGQHGRRAADEVAPWPAAAAGAAGGRPFGCGRLNQVADEGNDLHCLAQALRVRGRGVGGGSKGSSTTTRVGLLTDKITKTCGQVQASRMSQGRECMEAPCCKRPGTNAGGTLINWSNMACKEYALTVVFVGYHGTAVLCMTMLWGLG
jgi:hypothetical protein